MRLAMLSIILLDVRLAMFLMVKWCEQGISIFEIQKGKCCLPMLSSILLNLRLAMFLKGK